MPRIFYSIFQNILFIYIYIYFFFFLYERCYIHNIFTTNHMWLVVIGLNLNLTLRLLFVLTITTSNNLPLKIYCKNIMDISFLFKKTLKPPLSLISTPSLRSFIYLFIYFFSFTPPSFFFSFSFTLLSLHTWIDSFSFLSILILFLLFYLWWC